MPLVSGSGCYGIVRITYAFLQITHKVTSIISCCVVLQWRAPQLYLHVAVWVQPCCVATGKLPEAATAAASALQAVSAVSCCSMLHIMETYCTLRRWQKLFMLQKPATKRRSAQGVDQSAGSSVLTKPQYHSLFTLNNFCCVKSLQHQLSTEPHVTSLKFCCCFVNSQQRRRCASQRACWRQPVTLCLVCCLTNSSRNIDVGHVLRNRGHHHVWRRQQSTAWRGRSSNQRKG